jgi:hypothetical protein
MLSIADEGLEAGRAVSSPDDDIAGVGALLPSADTGLDGDGVNSSNRDGDGVSVSNAGRGPGDGEMVSNAEDGLEGGPGAKASSADDGLDSFSSFAPPDAGEGREE